MHANSRVLFELTQCRSSPRLRGEERQALIFINDLCLDRQLAAFHHKLEIIVATGVKSAHDAAGRIGAFYPTATSLRVAISIAKESVSSAVGVFVSSKGAEK